MIVDLRSDTVTRPSAGMRRAMAGAELGDDVFGDDPTVNRLQGRAAEMLGFGQALFFPSGTQSNLAALMSHCGRGDEYLVGQEAHTYRFEAGGGAVLGSIQPQPLANRADGTLDLAKSKPRSSRTIRISRARGCSRLENTIGGKVLSRKYLDDALKVATRRNLSTHLDGARIFKRLGESSAPARKISARDSIRFPSVCRKASARPPDAAAGRRGFHRQGAAREKNSRRRDAAIRPDRRGGTLRAGKQRRAAGGRTTPTPNGSPWDCATRVSTSRGLTRTCCS